MHPSAHVCINRLSVRGENPRRRDSPSSAANRSAASCSSLTLPLSPPPLHAAFASRSTFAFTSAHTRLTSCSSIHSTVPAASFLGAIWRAVKAGLLMPVLRSESLRLRICRAAGIAHATVPLGDLQGIALDVSEQLTHELERPSSRRDSGVSSCSTGDEGGPASEEGGSAGEDADADETPSLHGGGGNTESVASTSLEEDEVAMRPFLNTQSAVYQHWGHGHDDPRQAPPDHAGSY